MSVNLSDVPPWVYEYGPKVVSGLEKTAEQVAKLAGMLRGLLAAANQPRSVTIFTPWLTNPEAVANDRSHGGDPVWLYREAWERLHADKPEHVRIHWDKLSSSDQQKWCMNVDAVSSVLDERTPSPIDDANDRSYGGYKPNEAPSAR